MFNRDAVDRVTVLETEFTQFQSQFMVLMSTEKEAFKEVNISLKEIIKRIDESRILNEQSIKHIKADTLQAVAKDYVSKLEIYNQHTELRKSIVTDIHLERKSAMRDVWLIVLGFSACLTLAGWAYVNVIGQNRYDRAVHEIKEFTKEKGPS